MIHDFRREYLDLPLKDYILTFDDGLVSPLLYWNDINKLDTEKIFFIPTGAIECGMEGKPAERFLTVEQISFLHGHGDVTIGGHSHAHRRLDTHNSFTEAIEFLVDDTDRMMIWFCANLGFVPTHFCYPYNETNGVYEAIIKNKFGFKYVFGNERKDIEELL